MGKVTITVDDMSPQITYNGDWTRSQAATTLSGYFHNTIIGTTVLGNTATFAFNGTSIALFGSKKDDHGTYTVQVDQDAPLSATGKVTVEVAQVELFRKTNLDPTRTHQVVLTNTQAGSWLDLDYLVYETVVGGNDDEVVTTVVDDAAGVFILTPKNIGADPGGSTSWQTQHFSNQQCFNTTRTATTIDNYAVTIPFNGSSVQVFGGISGIHGLYGVSLDDRPQETFNGSTDLALGYNPQIQIYGASGLDEGPHEVRLTNLENKWLDVDYAVFNSSSSAGNDSSTASDPSASGSNASSSSTRKSAPVDAIVASVVSVIALAIAIGAFFFLRRRRRQRQEEQGNLVDMASIDGDEGPPSFLAGSNATRTASAGSSAPQLVDLAPTPFLFPPDDHGQHVTVATGQRPDLLSPMSSDSVTRSISTTSTPSDQHAHLFSGSGAVGQARRSKSGQVAPTPPTSVGGDRMHVDGREQDAGPIGSTNQGGQRLSMLPPDYHQAIQPFDG